MASCSTNKITYIFSTIISNNKSWLGEVPALFVFWILYLSETQYSVIKV